MSETIKPATDEECGWCGRLTRNHLSAYYYAFDATGVQEIDRILCSVASAGKSYHHTDDWSEEVIEPIQNAAKEAAARIEADRAELAKVQAENASLKASVEELEDMLQGSDDEAVDRLSAHIYRSWTTAERDRLKRRLMSTAELEATARAEKAEAEVERLSDPCPTCGHVLAADDAGALRCAVCDLRAEVERLKAERCVCSLICQSYLPDLDTGWCVVCGQSRACHKEGA